MANKKYTQEFKDSTVQLVLNNNEKPATIAKDLDLNLKTLYSWIQTYKRVKHRGSQTSYLLDSHIINQ